MPDNPMRDQAMKVLEGSSVTLDPVLLLTIVSLLINIYRCVRERGDDDTRLLERLQNPSSALRFRLRVMLRNQVGGDKAMRRQLEDALIARCQTLTLADVAQIGSYVRGMP